MNQNRSKNNSRKKPLLRWAIILVLAISYLIYNTLREKQDIEKNGIENTAIVQAVDYVNYITDEKSGKRVIFYRVKAEYIYEMDTVSKVFELQPNTYMEQFGSDLKVGESIKILHSRKNLENAIVVDQ